MSSVTSGICVALLGDIVRSRDAADRAALHRHVSDALAAANARHSPLHRLRVTVGDEFQGVFPTMGSALAASYTIRLALTGEADVRFGLGRGTVRVVDVESNIQDGSAWWSARAAIEAIEARAHGARRVLRTGLAAGDDAGANSIELVTAVEMVDALLASVDDTGRVILTTLLAGRPQSDAAGLLGISGSAVSQRVARGGLAILADAMTRLEEVS